MRDLEFGGPVRVPFAQVALPEAYCALLARVWGPEFEAKELSANGVGEALLRHAVWPDVHPVLRAHLVRLGAACVPSHRVDLVTDPRVRPALALCVDAPSQQEALSYTDRVDDYVAGAESEAEEDLLRAAADVGQACLAYAVMPREDDWVAPAFCALTHGQSDRRMLRSVAECVVPTAYRVPLVFSRRSCVMVV